MVLGEGTALLKAGLEILRPFLLFVCCQDLVQSTKINNTNIGYRGWEANVSLTQDSGAKGCLHFGLVQNGVYKRLDYVRSYLCEYDDISVVGPVTHVYYTVILYTTAKEIYVVLQRWILC
jgi:hypothetical protein